MTKSKNSYLRCEDMSEKSKDSLDTVITVIGELLEGILLVSYPKKSRAGGGEIRSSALVSFYTPSNNPVGTICPGISRKEEIHNEKT